MCYVYSEQLNEIIVSYSKYTIVTTYQNSTFILLFFYYPLSENTWQVREYSQVIFYKAKSAPTCDTI